LLIERRIVFSTSSSITALYIYGDWCCLRATFRPIISVTFFSVIAPSVQLRKKCVTIVVSDQFDAFVSLRSASACVQITSTSKLIIQTVFLLILRSCSWSVFVLFVVVSGWCVCYVSGVRRS